MADSRDTEQWVRFDLSTGEEKWSSCRVVREVCEELGLAYDAAVIAGHVRYECFDYELVDNEDEDGE